LFCRCKNLQDQIKSRISSKVKSQSFRIAQLPNISR
jgi:hypothetical protein